MTVEIILVDYNNATHTQHLLDMLDMYAQDPMGGGEPLPAETRTTLAKNLSQFSGAFSLLAMHDKQPVGFANCLPSFSTFTSKPLVNIHDIAVSPKARGLGVAQQLLEKIASIAKERGCPKVTLEVLSGNEPAKRAYEKFGFNGYQLSEETGQALFWELKL